MSCHGGLLQGGAGFWFFPHGLMMLLMVVGVCLIFRHFSRHRSCGAGSSTLSILEERYIKGEITKEEYLEKKDTLQKDR